LAVTVNPGIREALPDGFVFPFFTFIRLYYVGLNRVEVGVLFPTCSNEKAASYACKSIESAEFEFKPFKHLYLKHVFPTCFYNSLIKNWPDLTDEPSIGDLRGEDSPAHWKARKYVTKFDKYWDDFRKVISPNLELVLREKFQLSSDIKTNMALVEDGGSFHVGVHNDFGSQKTKVILLMYLPLGEEAGTVLHDNDKLVAKHVPALPNTGFAFSPFDDTWHSVNESEGRRHKISFRFTA
jgi:hypothetical protein